MSLNANAGSEGPALLSYRPCVGIVLINPDRKVWIGRRRPELTNGRGAFWQMPQGGIDESEDPAAAALRELAEETGAEKVDILGRTSGWLSYDLPAELVGIALHGRYRGQKQIWFAMRFLGDDSDFNIHAPEGGHEPEFDAWRWAPPQEVVEQITPFKRSVYEAVLKEFQPFLG